MNSKLLISMLLMAAVMLVTPGPSLQAALGKVETIHKFPGYPPHQGEETGSQNKGQAEQLNGQAGGSQARCGLTGGVARCGETGGQPTQNKPGSITVDQSNSQGKGMGQASTDQGNKDKTTNNKQEYMNEGEGTSQPGCGEDCPDDDDKQEESPVRPQKRDESEYREEDQDGKQDEKSKDNEDQEQETTTRSDKRRIHQNQDVSTADNDKDNYDKGSQESTTRSNKEKVHQSQDVSIAENDEDKNRNKDKGNTESQESTTRPNMDMGKEHQKGEKNTPRDVHHKDGLHNGIYHTGYNSGHYGNPKADLRIFGF